MGRKIPAKKHRGVKDPIKQQATRLQSVKSKINAPPRDPDEQPVPRSVTRLFAFLNKDKVATKKKKKPKQLPCKDDVGSPSGVGENPIAHLKKLPGESGRSFSLRINSAVKTLHDPLEQDYPQDLEVEDVKGEQMATERARRRRKRERGARGVDEPAEKLNRRQKLALKIKTKKSRQAEEAARPELVYERVAFGDVAHAPPALPARRPAPRAATLPALDAAPRPGRRTLLLSAALAGGAPAAAAATERRRLAAVDAYRRLKKERQLQRNTRQK